MRILTCNAKRVQMLTGCTSNQIIMSAHPLQHPHTPTHTSLTAFPPRFSRLPEIECWTSSASHGISCFDQSPSSPLDSSCHKLISPPPQETLNEPILPNNPTPPQPFGP